MVCFGRTWMLVLVLLSSVLALWLMLVSSGGEDRVGVNINQSSASATTESTTTFLKGSSSDQSNEVFKEDPVLIGEFL
jgi:hypothetical protein